MKKPMNSGSAFYDYKAHYSTVLLALVDADCKFLYVDVGACGRASDAGVWDRCTLKQAVEGGMLGIPDPQNIPFSDKQCPYVFVGDDAFPLKEYMMKPYPGRGVTVDRRIFNYRLSRARRTSENAFGILAARFQVFQNSIRVSPNNAKDITLATIALHNMLIQTSRDTYTPQEVIDSEHPNQGIFEALEAVGRGHGNNAKEVRETFKEYFNNEGAVSWQNEKALLH